MFHHCGTLIQTINLELATPSDVTYQPMTGAGLPLPPLMFSHLHPPLPFAITWGKDNEGYLPLLVSMVLIKA